MSAKDIVLNIARGEIGYLEKKTNSNLDNKTANAGYNNYTKYARDLDKKKIYNTPKNGFPWCDVFFDWCMIEAFGVDDAMKITNQPIGGCGAGCVYSAGYYKSMGRFYITDPQPGDQIFFFSSGVIGHTGIVEKVEGTRVYTIEGNTSSGAGVIDNGGAVCAKYYTIGDPRIAGYGRPKWELVEEIESKVTYENWNGGYICTIPFDKIEHIENCLMNNSKGEIVTSAAKRVKWNGRAPDLIVNSALFDMKTYKPASGIVNEGTKLYLPSVLGIAFVNKQTPVLSYMNNVSAPDWIGAYPILVRNGEVSAPFTTAVSPYSKLARTVVGLKKDGVVFGYVPATNGVTLTEAANKMISIGCQDVINLDGGGSTACCSEKATYDQGRKVYAFIGVWYEGGKGNVAAGSTTQDCSNTTVPTKPTSTTNVVASSGWLIDKTAAAGKKLYVDIKPASTLNVRKTGSTSAPVVGLLKRGMWVYWYGYTTADKKWQYIKMQNGTCGYVSAQYVTDKQVV